jgi:L-amino acid N-acyltransferase YncA/predicted enzyme related to lactoylglutathione lyase
MSVRQLRLVVAAEDYEAAVAFYRDGLGLVEEEAIAGPGGAHVTILAAGRATLELANPAQRAYIDEVEVGRAVSPRLRVAFGVDDARAVTAELVAAGAQEIAAPRPTPFGSVNARLDAPGGLQITVFQPTGGGPVDARPDAPGGPRMFRPAGGDPVDARLDEPGGMRMVRPAGGDPVDARLLDQIAGLERTGGDLEIRDAVAADWPAIWPFFREIVAAGETYAWPPDMAEDAARAAWFPAQARTVVAVLDGSVVGSAKLQPNQQGPGAHVANASFMVDPAYGGRGVGRALAEHVLAAAAAAGYRAMQFNAVVATNTGAVALWRSLGFAVVGTVPDAFDHPAHGPVDLLVMHRRL